MAELGFEVAVCFQSLAHQLCCLSGILVSNSFIASNTQENSLNGQAQEQR